MINRLEKLGRGLWKRKRKILILMLKTGLAAVVAVGVLVAVSEWYADSASRGRLFDHPRDVPVRAAALVLGCSPTFMGGPNGYFDNRMDTAAEVWKEGKVTAFVVSGDNSSHDYHEPEAMKQALVERGVPEDRIVCDFAGLRTLDSVVRMKEVFGASQMIVISQTFHNRRALAIARYNGMDAYAVNAPDVPNRRSRVKSWIRERGARRWMMMDLWLWGREPRCLGDPVALPDEDGGPVQTPHNS